jgi:CheY-like chemotaxis protein
MDDLAWPAWPSLLAIDDDPDRYRDLARRLVPHRVAVLVAHEVAAVERMLAAKRKAPIVGLFLDRDMPERVGEDWVERLPDLPVCVSSANRAGARVIVARLQARGLPHVVMSALDAAPEERWLGWALDVVGRWRMARLAVIA